MGSGRALPTGSAGSGFSPAGRGRVGSFRSAEAERSDHAPTIRADGIRPNARPIMQCLVRRKSRPPRGVTPNNRTATEARARFPFRKSAYKADPGEWNGIRTRDPMHVRHLLLPSELSFLCVTGRTRTDISGDNPRRSTLELQPQPSPGGTRKRKASRAGRSSANPFPRPDEGAGKWPGSEHNAREKLRETKKL